MLQADHAAGKIAPPTPDMGGDVVAYRSTIALGTADLTLNNIIEMGPIPAGCLLVDVILDSDDLDSGGSPAITLDVGIMSGTYGNLLDDAGNARTCDATIIAASTVAQAGGVARPTLASAFRTARVATDTSIGVKIHAAPGTAVAGTIGLTVLIRG
jgi:hypothetical protein